MLNAKKIRLVIAVLGSVFFLVYFLFFDEFICNSNSQNNSSQEGKTLEEIYSKDIYAENAELKTKWEKDMMYYKIILKGKYVDLFKPPEDSIYQYRNIAVNVTDKTNFVMLKIDLVETNLVFDKTDNTMFYDGMVSMSPDIYRKLENIMIIYDDTVE